MERAPGNVHDEYLRAADGLALYYRERTVPDARAHVVLVHGVSEHYGRYRHVEDFLARRRIGFSTIDLRGHGQSEGRRVFVQRFDEYLADVDLLVERARRHSPKLFMIGHSLGGLIAVRYCQTRQPDFRGLITSGAALKPTIKPSPPLFFVLKALNRLYPATPVPNLVKVDKISRDPEIVRRYRSDPLVPKFLTTSFGMASLAAMEAALREAARIAIPALVMHGGGDELVAPSASEDLFQGLRVADKTLRIYPELYHELFNEPERELVLGDVASWIEGRSEA